MVVMKDNKREKRVGDLMVNPKEEFLGSMREEEVLQKELGALKGKYTQLIARYKNMEEEVNKVQREKVVLEEGHATKVKEFQTSLNLSEVNKKKLEEKVELLHKEEVVVKLGHETKVKELLTSLNHSEDNKKKLETKVQDLKINVECLGIKLNISLDLVDELEKKSSKFNDTRAAMVKVLEAKKRKLIFIKTKYKESQKSELELKKTEVSLRDEIALSRELLKLADKIRKESYKEQKFGAEIEDEFFGNMKDTMGKWEVARGEKDKNVLKVLQPYHEGVLELTGNAQEILILAQGKGMSASEITGHVQQEIAGVAKLSGQLTVQQKEARSAKKRRSRINKAEKRRISKVQEKGEDGAEPLLVERGGDEGGRGKDGVDPLLVEGGGDEGGRGMDYSNLSELVSGEGGCKGTRNAFTGQNLYHVNVESNVTSCQCRG